MFKKKLEIFLCNIKLNSICNKFLFIVGLVASLKNYVGKEITKLNNEKSSVNIEMIRKNPDLISNVAKAISEKYKKVLCHVLYIKGIYTVVTCIFLSLNADFYDIC